jgi:hypothetical protein
VVIAKEDTEEGHDDNYGYDRGNHGYGYGYGYGCAVYDGSGEGW